MNLFGLFGPEKVEFLDVYDKTLTYRSKSKKHTPGNLSKINLQVFIDGAMQGLKMEIVVDSVRQLPDRSYLVISQIVGTPAETEQICLVLNDAPKPDIGKLARRSERIPIGLRVLSQQLPGFRAVTIDVSLQGAQLQSEKLIAVDTVMDLTFELELNDIPELTLRGIAVWSAAEEERRKAFRVGVEFTEQHPQTQALWNRAYAQIVRLQTASVMQRSMSSDV